MLRFPRHTLKLVLAACLLFPVSCLLPLPAHAALATPVASYTIDVTLDVEAKTLTARQTVTYVNTTAEPIPDLVFHLYLNAFRDRDSLFLQEAGPVYRGHRWDPEHPGWIEVTDIRLLDGTQLQLEEIEDGAPSDARPKSAEWRLSKGDGTLARARLPAPVQPGEEVRVELDFRAQLPRVFARTGYSDDFFMVGQWFPKLGVWQDGAWNAYPFHANAEFYADFGTYDVAITLPTGYVTGGTGLPVSTVEHADGTQTVRYRAEDVIDFAWTASPDFRQATREVDGLEVLYLYLPEHDWTVERVLDASEAAMRHYSRWYGPYPYPRITVVDVPDEAPEAGGMEYPTLIVAGTMSMLGLGTGVTRAGFDRSLELLVAHELGHQWWQSMVGFNEAEEPWLDEGLTDYSALRLMETLYPADASLVDAGNLHIGYLDARRMEYLLDPALPMYGRAWDFGEIEYGIAAYSKPVVSLRTLERVLGEETMLDILSSFFQRYRFAHPTTDDFRAVAEEVSDRDLSWFFDGLVYDGRVLNYAVNAIDEHSVTVARQGDLVIPTEVLVTFVDGSTVLERWDGVQSEVTFAYPDRPPVRSAQVDPDRHLVVDLRWSDNGLSRRLQVFPWLALVGRILYGLQNALLALGGL